MYVIVIVTALSRPEELQLYDGHHHGRSRFRSDPAPAPDLGGRVQGPHGDVQADGHHSRVQGGCGFAVGGALPRFLLFLSQSNYKNYRDKLSITPVPAVPYIGVFLKDLTFIADGNPDYIRGGLVNLHKRRQVWNVS